MCSGVLVHSDTQSLGPVGFSGVFGGGFGFGFGFGLLILNMLRYKNDILDIDMRNLVSWFWESSQDRIRIWLNSMEGEIRKEDFRRPIYTEVVRSRYE